jgi:hypothetical protein
MARCGHDGCERPAPYTGEVNGDIPMPMCEPHYKRWYRGSKNEKEIRYITPVTAEKYQAAASLLASGWSIARAARALGLGASTLQAAIARQRRHPLQLIATDDHTESRDFPATLP